MKRILLLILSCIYLTVASGVVISVHYCMGQQTELRYNFHSSKKCDKCGMKNNQGCCHDEYKIMKLTLDQQLAKKDGQGPNHHYCSSDVPVLSLNMPIQGVRVHPSNHYFSPPDKRNTHLFRYTCTYRI